MKVYIISANWGRGGPGGIAKDLYYTLLENNHIVRFGYSRETIPADVNSYKFGTTIGVYSHAFLTRIFDKGGFYSKHDTKRLIKDIIEFKPDVISIHNPLGYTLNIPMLMRFVDSFGVPTFYTLHDCWLFTGHCTTELCDRLSIGCGKCPNLREFPKSFVFDNSRKNLIFKQKHFSNIKNLQLISCSRWMYELASSSYLKNYKNTIINNGIDLSIFKPTESTFRKDYGLDGKQIILGVASVWSTRKGQDFFYDVSKVISDNKVIVLVGRGINKKISSLKNVVCVGPVTSPLELAKIYSSADVFVNPTIGDNYPTVNLEAIACGTPVVTFDTGGSGEMVGECGIIVKKGSLKELLSAISKVLNSHFDSNKCVDHAREFDKRIKYSKYLTLFNEVLKNEA